MAAINSRECMEGLSMYFKRDYRHDNTIFRGDFEAEVIQKRTIIQKERIHLRFKAYEHERTSALAYSMDCSVSLAATMRDCWYWKSRRFYTNGGFRGN